MKNLLIAINMILILTSYAASAQSPIQGETALARVGTPYIYYWNFGSADPKPNPTGTNMGGYKWYTDHGTVNSEWSTGNAVNASITFTSPGTTRVWVNWQGGEKQSITFTVKDAGTAAPTVYIGAEKFCGYTRMWRQGEPPSGYDWWWQTSYTGESLSLGKADTLRVLSPTSIYLRPRKSTAPFTWGESSTFGPVNVSTWHAGTPIATAFTFNVFYDVPSTISVFHQANVTYYNWYLNDFGPPFQGARSIDRRFSSDATVFVSSFNGCESPKEPVQIKVIPLPQITTENSNSPDVSDGKYVTLKTTRPFDTYKWYSSTGLIATTPSITTNTPGYYYVQVSQANVSGGTAVLSPLFPVTTKSDQNYVSTIEVQIPGVSDPAVAFTLPLDKRTESLAYFDGLGRQIQNVNRQASPTHHDVIQPFQYDEFGRENYKYPTYVHGEGNGWMKIDPTGKAVGGYDGTVHNQFYQNSNAVSHDNKAFSKIEFDQSPLNRETKKYGAGESWYANDKYTTTKYLSNVDGALLNTGQEKIVAWKIGNNDELLFENAPQYYYQTNEIYIKITTDEQNHSVREYTNKQGQLILKKVQVSNEFFDLNDLDNWACTYYVYNDFNNLVMVIPPQAVKEILSTN